MEGCSSKQNYAFLSEDPMNSKYSIKNLLFYRAIPNYQISYPTNGHNIYTCKDCGDGFILESSYQDHIQRKSVLIKYQCRHCSRRVLTFFNRCNLLSHIRSHTVKTATINVSDLSVDPLPLNFFKIKKDNPTLVPIAPVPFANTLHSDNTPQSSNPLQFDDAPQPFTDTSYSADLTQSNNIQQSDNAPPPDNAPKYVNTKITSLQPADANQNNTNIHNGVKSSTCIECKIDITSTGILYVDRASHYMRYTNQVYSCPICLFNLPTLCGLRAHLRLHLRIAPFFCPECGMQMNNKSVIYPYTHGCEGFNMMRATARSQCHMEKCQLFHPNHFNKHMTENHFKIIYKCSMCVVACFNESTMIKHAKAQNHDICPQRFYQCDLCPGRLVMLNHTDRHIRSHTQIPVYPCWTCNKPFKQVVEFVNHHIEKHCQNDDFLKDMLLNIGSPNVEDMLPDRPVKKIYRVVKRCDQCQRNFTYKCQFEDINILPNSCPYKCVPGAKSLDIHKSIRCPLCDSKLDQAWKTIKDHFNTNHKEHRCLDAKLTVEKLNIKKYFNADKKNKVLAGTVKKQCIRKARQKVLKNRKIDVQINQTKETMDIFDRNICPKCKEEYETKELLEKHISTHRDPCMAYQCMECGECFVVKTSFSTHMLLEHDINNVDEYINEKQCFNEYALGKCVDSVDEEPLNENQCKICRDQFDSSEDLEKHFRVHGMAFLIKNSLNKVSN